MLISYIEIILSVFNASLKFNQEEDFKDEFMKSTGYSSSIITKDISWDTRSQSS